MDSKTTVYGRNARPFNDPTRWIPTGSHHLDAIMGRGLEKDRILEVFGKSKTRKSTLLIALLAMAQRHRFHPVHGCPLPMSLIENIVLNGQIGDKDKPHLYHPKLREFFKASGGSGLPADQPWPSDQFAPGELEANFMLRSPLMQDASVADRLESAKKDELLALYEKVKKKEVTEVPEGKKKKVTYWKGKTLQRFRYEWLLALAKKFDFPLHVYIPPMRCAYYESEVGGFLPEQAIRLGVDINKLLHADITKVRFLEEMFEDAVRVARQGTLDGVETYIIFDSVSAIPTKNEKYTPDRVGMFGDKAGKIRKLWSRFGGDFMANHATVAAITHESGLGAKTGGAATGFISSLCLRMSVQMTKTGEIEDDAWLKTKDGLVKGIKLKVKPTKHRGGADDKWYSTQFLYAGNRLFDPCTDIWRFCRDFGIIETSGSWFSTSKAWEDRGFKLKSFHQKDWVDIYKEHLAKNFWGRLVESYYEERYRLVQEAFAKKSQKTDDDWF